MRCILCYANSILIISAKTQARKGMIFYNNANGISTFKKHVCANHCMMEKIFLKTNLKKKNLMRDNLQRNELM